MTGTLPLHLKIQRHLLEKIHSGDWPPQYRIPPEERLAEEFAVSRMTANKAIRDLVQKGYLTRQPGVGTFITDRKAESSLIEVHNIAEEVQSRDHVYTSEVLRAEPLEADDEISVYLGVRSSARVFHTLIVHREDGVPIQLEDRYVNPSRVPHYLETDFTQHTPNEVLVAACPINDVEHVVEAVLVDTNTARRLDIAPHEPCLRMIRRTWSGDHLISYARLIHPGDRYKLRSSLHTH